MMKFSTDEVEFAIDRLGRLKYLVFSFHSKRLYLYWIFIWRKSAGCATETLLLLSVFPNDQTAILYVLSLIPLVA